MSYDSWLMTDPRDYLPNPRDYWDYIDEAEMFNYAMEDEEDEFLDHLADNEFFPEGLPKDEEESYAYSAWESGDSELALLIEQFYEDWDRREHLLRSRYPDLR